METSYPEGEGGHLQADEFNRGWLTHDLWLTSAANCPATYNEL